MATLNKTDNPLAKKEIVPKEWHPQQSKLLKNWAEVASSYRWMHNQAYMIYKKKNLNFMIPLIIMSTVTGTANFAQTTFPETIRPYVPQIIGAINLISAIMTTIYQFLKISEFMESHRISSINYGKLARTITVELSLPVKDRNSGGAECVKVSRTEIDRLIEQSPAIPKKILFAYESLFSGKGLSEPEIIVINQVDIYEDIENKTATTVAEAGAKLKGLLKKPFIVKSNNSPTSRKNEEVQKETSSLAGTFNSVVSQLKEKIGNISPKKEPVLPKFDQIETTKELSKGLSKELSLKPIKIEEKHGYAKELIHEIIEPIILQDIELPIENIELPIETAHPPSEASEEMSETGQIVHSLVDSLVEETVQTAGGIADELEALRSSKKVSKRS
jgi:hypothetical protein